MMKIFRLFGLLGICLLALSSCSKEELLTGEGLEHKKPSGKIEGLYSVTVNGQVASAVKTRGLDDVLNVPNGRVLGAGLYDGSQKFNLRVLPNVGCRIKTFEGGKIGEPVESHLTAANRSGATLVKKVQESDWKFNVEIVKTFRIRVASSTSQSVELLIDGERVAEKVYGEGDPCTLSVRYPMNGNEVFDGWYDGTTKLSSDVSYTFTVSASKTIEAKFKKREEKTILVKTTWRSYFSGDGYTRREYTMAIHADVPVVLSLEGVCEEQSGYDGDVNRRDEVLTVTNDKEGEWMNEENVPFGDEDARGAYRREYDWQKFSLTINGRRVETGRKINFYSVAPKPFPYFVDGVMYNVKFEKISGN